MNDKSEVTYFLKKLQGALQEKLEKDEISKCNKFFNSIYDRLVGGGYPFASCFSTLEDNAAQWERYADDAKGISIVFNTSYLISLFLYQRFLFEQIFYSYDITAHEHFEILYEYFNSGKLEHFSSETGLKDNILACAYLRNHPSFSTESETWFQQGMKNM